MNQIRIKPLINETNLGFFLRFPASSTQQWAMCKPCPAPLDSQPRFLVVKLEVGDFGGRRIGNAIKDKRTGGRKRGWWVQIPRSDSSLLLMSNRQHHYHSTALRKQTSPVLP